MQKWHVILSEADHKKIKMALRSDKVPMEAKKRAQILLDLDESNGRKADSITSTTNNN